MTRRAAARGAAIALLAFAAALAACSNLGYSLRAAAGGAALLAKRRPIEKVLARPGLDPETRRKLETVEEIRAFAATELALPVGRAYRSYVELRRPAVTWNVVATPELSLAPETWCFPVAGCVSYRGYFHRDRAERFAAKLGSRGLDVAIHGASAYSSLGWFADPVLDTFLDGPDWRIAELLFHELAHRVVYVRDDTAFNESFASLVEELGLERWLASRGDAAQAEDARRARAEDRRFDAMLQAAREDLEALYGSDRAAAEKRLEKGRIFEDLAGDLRRARDSAELSPRFEGWLARPLNNADLAAVGAYDSLVQPLRAIWSQRPEFESFYAAIRRIAALPRAERDRLLAAPGRD